LLLSKLNRWYCETPFVPTDLWARIKEYDQRPAKEGFTQVLSKKQQLNMKKQVLLGKPHYQVRVKGGPPPSSKWCYIEMSEGHDIQGSVWLDMLPTELLFDFFRDRIGSPNYRLTSVFFYCFGFFIEGFGLVSPLLVYIFFPFLINFRDLKAKDGGVPECQPSWAVGVASWCLFVSLLSKKRN